MLPFAHHLPAGIRSARSTLPQSFHLPCRRSWVPVGPRGGASPAAVQLISLALDATGTPVCAFDDASAGRKLTVTRFNAATGKWTPLGQAGLTLGAISAVDLQTSPTKQLFV